MKCKVHTAYAPNGEKSKLFEKLVDTFEDENKALSLWVGLRTPTGRTVFGDWKDEEFDKTRLDENGEPLFEDVVRSEYIEDQQVIKETDKKLLEYKKANEKILAMFTKARDVIIRRIAELDRNKSDNETVEFVKNKLNKTKEALRVLDWRTGVVSFSATAKSNITYAMGRIDKELNKPNPDAKTLHRFYNYLTAFDVLDEMRNEILANPIMAESMSEELKEINNLIGEKESAKTKYKNFHKDRVATILSDKSYKYAKEEILAMLDRSEGDVAATERWLFFAGDSKDAVVSLVAKLVNEQQQKTRHASIEFTKALSEKLQAMENERSEFKGNAEKLYDPMLEKDSNGNLTGYLVHPTESKPQYETFKAKYEGTKTFEFYEFFLKEYNRLNDNLPMSQRMGHRLPSVMKSTLDAVLSSDKKLNKLWDVEKQKWIATNTDTELGQKTDDSQRVIDTIPIHFTQSYDSAVFNTEYNRLKKAGVADMDARVAATEYAKNKLPESISYDLAASLQSFQYMSENYANMSEVLDVAEGARDYLYDRKLEVVNSKGVPFISKIKDSFGSQITDNKTLIGGAESNAYKLLDTYLKMQVFGQTEQDLGNFNIGNMQIDTRKLIKNLMSYNSHVMIGFNVLAASSNIAMGESLQWADAFGGEYYTAKNYIKAKNEYYKNIPKLLEDVTSRTPQSKIGLINEYYDFLGDYHPGGVGATDSSVIRRAAKSGSLFFLNSMGEHKMQSQAAMAVLMSTKTYDSEGKEIGTLWSAHEAKNGELVTSNVYIKVNGELVKYTQKQKDTVSRQIQTMLRRMHGNYNKQTAAAWQRNAYLGLIGQFRKWIADGASRRFGKKYSNEFAEQDLEGSYRSFGKWVAGLIEDITKLKLDVGTNWDSMTDHQKANVIRTSMELGFIAITAISLAILKELASGLDDEKDKYKLAALRYSMYLANRLQTELLFYVNPMDTWQILSKPAATMATLERIGNTLNYALPWNWDEKYEAGINKGESKFKVSVIKNLPVVPQIIKLSPEGMKGQIEFFNIH